MALKEFGLMVLAAGLLSADSEDPKKFHVLDVLPGSQCYHDRPLISLARSQQALEQLWGDAFSRQVQSGPLNVIPEFGKPLPKLNMKKVMVLGVFGGVNRNCIDGYEVVKAELTHERAVIRLAPHRTQDLLNTMSQPYSLVLLTRTKREVDVEMPVVDDQGETQWKVVAEIASVKE